MSLHVEIIDDTHGASTPRQLEDGSELAAALESILRDLNDTSSRSQRWLGMTLIELQQTLEDDGIDAQQAHEFATQVRTNAFHEAAVGELSVMLEPLDEEPKLVPDIAMTMAAMFDHVAARLGPGMRMFVRKEVLE